MGCTTVILVFHASSEYYAWYNDSFEILYNSKHTCSTHGAHFVFQDIKCTVIQDDTAPIHMVITVYSSFEEQAHKVEHLLWWSTQLPDLNITELLLGVLETKIYKTFSMTTAPAGTQQLFCTINDLRSLYRYFEII